MTSILDKIAALIAAPKAETLSPDDLLHRRPFAEPVIVMTPEGTKISNISKMVTEAMTCERPFRRKGVVKIERPDLMIEFLNCFRDSGSVLFVSERSLTTPGDGPIMTGVINYHHSGEEHFVLDAHGMNGADPTARHGDHMGVYEFPLSDEFIAWMKVTSGGLSMTQADLCTFIEERVMDFVQPTPYLISGGYTGEEDAEAWEDPMLDISRRLGARFGSFAELKALSLEFEIRDNQKVKTKRNPQTGEATFIFESEHEKVHGGSVDVPGLFIIAIPMFTGGPLYRMCVRFSYRKHGDSILFGLSVFRLRDTFRRGLESVVDYVVQGTIVPDADHDVGIEGEVLPENDESLAYPIRVIWGRP